MKLSSELKDFESTIRKFFEKEASLSYVRGRFEGGLESDPAVRKKLDALGLSEFFRDSGGTIRELAIISRETGRALFPEMIVDELLFATMVKDQTPVRGILLLGELRGSPNQLLVRGSKDADLILFEREGRVFLSTTPNKGISTVKKDHLDKTLPLTEVKISEGSFKEIGSAEDLPLNDYLSILRAAEIAGALEAAVSMTREYVKTRRQFEVPIGGFQSVQHTLANMHLVTEALSSLVDFAAWSAIDSPTQRKLSSISAIAFACEKGPEVIESAIQLHGGIGFTWEYDLHFYLRRVKSIASLYGGIEDHADKILEATI